MERAQVFGPNGKVRDNVILEQRIALDEHLRPVPLETRLPTQAELQKKVWKSHLGPHAEQQLAYCLPHPDDLQRQQEADRQAIDEFLKRQRAPRTAGNIVIAAKLLELDKARRVALYGKEAVTREDGVVVVPPLRTGKGAKSRRFPKRVGSRRGMYRLPGETADFHVVDGTEEALRETKIDIDDDKHNRLLHEGRPITFGYPILWREQA